MAGVRPAGLRAAPGAMGDGHAALLDELGFGWSSSTHGDDRPHRLWSAGRPTPVVELPWLWEYADHPCFLYNGGPVAFPPGESRIPAYGDVLADWKDSFDAFRDHGLCWIPALDPQSIGKPGRTLMLEELLDHIRGHDDVWFATGAQVAEHWRRTAGQGTEPGPEPGPEPDAHPQRVRATWHSSPPPTGP
ncbi:hypothetical protein SSPO_025960 [Streptomyces antimycoticus]|uniref:Uncharacterized protein n=1 Tax=Streptomyces antimycoticus TaxID=68175 RepID=A0A499UJR5_9ACTN|nr:hypothetical protein [Streptomyces antimycoticus]BBJ39878.1 hypothetical protein SSPO_025960 [Streptomyces antimycoticus]